MIFLTQFIVFLANTSKYSELPESVLRMNLRWDHFVAGSCIESQFTRTGDGAGDARGRRDRAAATLFANPGGSDRGPGASAADR